ncbi:indolepyruvate ferredoxin oxidoreductase family protein [Tianweitania sediminis]|uniref:Indolepyruvate ferredoxin oxidoreductase family protein n=1 Tax=Tianweitania sediminis TaxID=1502156 RepID=A0A8J7UHV4_9HYPH|nr:indolepyruvate ferredoxin oxidoreductase family protein [Tianweitania sediminis]MBP0438213.1 indolepyruvate ferredoxin oxidoreductase family protein [Tianweitania sediminis]
MTLHAVSLDDKFDLSKERIFLNGSQAVVRMLLMQRESDRRAGYNTAGFVSGYRGSPLGGLDQQLWKARQQLSGSDIVFQPGLNEELAATACWGTQQTELLGEGKHDGVFALWYGKGPGVDRSGDVFRHANLAGSSPHGGVLALMGDDHTAESSTNAHATEFLFVDTMIPIFNPAGVQELIDYGLYGYALSRFAGTWAALKCVKDNIESTASVDVSLERLGIVLPEIDLPPGGLSIRHEIDQLGQEGRLHNYKRAAAAAFIAANNLNQIVFSGGVDAKIGIITTGKSYLDVRQALEDIGIDERRANQIGIRLFKIACPWPLDYQHLREFARGLEMVIVVEEKRSLIETQVRENLYGTASQPVVVGKRDERGETLFSPQGALDPNDIAIALGERVLRVIGPAEDIAARVNKLKQFQAMLADTKDVAGRTPYFCSGCPHNSSTKVPEGSLAGGGIGCHFMALWMDRSTVGFTAMGGEGAQWVGQAPFSKREHLFQNLGDGTYNHSGSLALRFALASGANITYKILYNDAVAMTGGQPHEGSLTLDMIAAQVRAEGVQRIAVVTDEPTKYAGKVQFPAGVTIDHRDDLDRVQRDLRELKGVSVLLYDQTCAAEKRRRRKRGTFPDPDKRVIINDLVCEGCGDCGVQSNCVSVQPLQTEFGRKRRIDQSSCNKDFSCVKGFCPSFVTVHGGKLRKTEGLAGTEDPLAGVPDPEPAVLGKSGWAAVIDGVGGTGVVTIGAVLGMAAHLEDKGCGMIDMAGLAQKGGAVFSHVRIAPTPADIHAIRVSAGKADLILGCDLVVSGNKKVLSAAREGETLFVANTAEVMPGDFARMADFSLPTERLKKAIRTAVGEDRAFFFDATRAASALFGNSLGANMLLLGMAFQKGGLPLSAAAVERAIELNGEAVAMNIAAFRWGRRAACDPAFVRDLADKRTAGSSEPALALTLAEIVERRAAFLVGYQNEAYARRYKDRVAQLAAAEDRVAPNSTVVAEAAARSLFKLMAIKDEYEVARLYTDGSFARQLSNQFSSYDRLEFHLAPPILGRRDAAGRAKKSSFGPWMLRGFNVLARLKRLRGTPLDPFGYMAERRMERTLLADFEADLDLIEAQLAPGRIEAAAALASLPLTIRGFGHVKHANAEKAQAERLRLRERLQAALPVQLEAAE